MYIGQCRKARKCPDDNRNCVYMAGPAGNARIQARTTLQFSLPKAVPL